MKGRGEKEKEKGGERKQTLFSRGPVCYDYVTDGYTFSQSQASGLSGLPGMGLRVAHPTASITLSLTCFLKSLSIDTALRSCFPS